MLSALPCPGPACFPGASSPPAHQRTSAPAHCHSRKERHDIEKARTVPSE